MGYIIPTAGDDFKEEVIAEIPGPTAGDILEVDVTPSLQLWVGGEENLGWLFFPDLNGTNGVGVQSSDAAEAEISVLIIETDAGTFEFREGENGYTGLQDAWIGNQNARFSTNFGTGPTMDLELDSPEDVEFVLLRFDNIIGSEANQVPPNTQINQAILRLNVVDTGGDLVFVDEILPHSETVGGIEINTRFDETTVTFENFVSDSFFPQVDVEIGDIITEFTPNTLGPVDLDVTSSVQKWVNGEAENLGWLLEPTGGSGVAFAAKEAPLSVPKLTVIIEGEGTPVGDFMLHE